MAEKTETKDLVKAMDPWDYEKAIKIVKPMVESHRNLTLKLVKELFAAREALANPGFRSDLTSCQMARGSKQITPITSSQNDTRFHTFEEFLEAVDLPKRTAYRWLALYDPKEDRLLDMDEFKARKVLEFEGLIKILRNTKNVGRDWRPEGWSAECERYYQRLLLEERRLEIIEEDNLEEEIGIISYNRLKELIRLEDEGPSVEDLMRFKHSMDHYKKYCTPKVEARDQILVATFVQKAIEQFQPDVRPEVARALAEITLAYTEEIK